MSALLSSVTATDFRSIRGTVTVPLNAPVVLLHGPNGAGKTSILSAIELALTGEVAAARRADSSYKSHLVHRGAEFGQVKVSTEGLALAKVETTGLTVRPQSTVGQPILDGDAARFFSERCYLAQSTLGRLLEIYQNAKSSGDSPLTRFVKDLLGLDYLDMLIEGLHPAQDVRNLRRLASEYANVEQERETATSRLNATKGSLISVRNEISKLKSDVLSVVNSAAQISPPISTFTDEIKQQIFSDDFESRMVQLSGARRDVASLKHRLKDVILNQAADGRERLEEEENTRDVLGELDHWWTESGSGLEALLVEVQKDFPELPSIASTDPILAHEAALERVNNEIERCGTQLSNDDVLASSLELSEKAIEQHRARIAIADEQIGGISISSEALSRVLAELIPHIHGEDCLLCGRDFSEVSSEPLAQRVAAQVGLLTEQAARLEELTKARLSVVTELSISQRALDATLARRITSAVRSTLQARVDRLKEFQWRLLNLQVSASSGADAMRRANAARQRLAVMRASDQLTVDLRAELVRLCFELDQPAPKDAENIRDVAELLEQFVVAELQKLELRQASRRVMLDQLDRIAKLHVQEAELEQSKTGAEEEVLAASAALARAESVRQSAKNVARAAADARMTTVGSVFNSALNKVWRDLFVRLAPTEPYVPAFCLPRNPGDPITAQLETVHRHGGAGGTPGAMLSAGNLNTAALTLFLALHLSVKPQLPWLILDDPVQSMDEVHISQFAALLRTLSKELGRQVIIAVHDRPLFEYLALELSPAFQGDRLITVELTRSSAGVSVAEPTYRTWEPDLAIAA